MIKRLIPFATLLGVLVGLSEVAAAKSRFEILPTAAIALDRAEVQLRETRFRGHNGVDAFVKLRGVTQVSSGTPFNGNASLVLFVRKSGICQPYFSPPLPVSDGKASVKLTGADLSLGEGARIELCLGPWLTVQGTLGAGIRTDVRRKTSGDLIAAAPYSVSRASYQLGSRPAPEVLQTMVRVSGLAEDGERISSTNARLRLALSTVPGQCADYLSRPMALELGSLNERLNAADFGLSIPPGVHPALCEHPELLIDGETVLVGGLEQGVDADLSQPSEPLDPGQQNANGLFDLINVNARRTLVRSDRFGNTFAADEATVFDVVQTAGNQGPFSGHVSVRVRDSYGDEALDEVAFFDLFRGEAWKASFELPSPLLGLYEIEVETFDEIGRSQGAVTETLGVVPPFSLSPEPDSRVGYFVRFDAGDMTRFDGIARQMKALGIHWVRDGLVWSTDDRRDPPDKSNPAWLNSADLEARVATYAEVGIEPFIEVASMARWASSRPDNVEPIDPPSRNLPVWAFSMPSAANDYQHWRDFVRTLATRLSGLVFHYGVWNEPNSFHYFEPLVPEASRGPAGASYRRLVGLTADEIRAVEPSAKIVVNMAPDRNPPFESNLLSPSAAPGEPYPDPGSMFDVFGYHYGSTEGRFEDESASIVSDTRSHLLTHYGIDMVAEGKEYWNTEAYGANATRGPSSAPFDIPTLDRWLNEAADGSTRMFHFIYHVVGAVPYFGTLPVNGDYTPRHHAITVRTLSDQVGSAAFVRKREMNPTKTYWSYLFNRDGTNVVAVLTPFSALWDVDSAQAATFRLVGQGSRTSVDVVDLMGNRTSVPVTGGNQFQVPIMGQVFFVEGLNFATDVPVTFVSVP